MKLIITPKQDLSIKLINFLDVLEKKHTVPIITPTELNEMAGIYINVETTPALMDYDETIYYDLETIRNKLIAL
jgi:hypothetical protein